MKKFKENIKRVDFDPEITRALHFRYKQELCSRIENYHLWPLLNACQRKNLNIREYLENQRIIYQRELEYN